MAKTIGRLLSYIRYAKKQFFIGMTLLLLSSLAGLYSPIIAKNLIDKQIIPAGQSRSLAWGSFLTFIGLYLALNLTSYLLAYWGRFLLKKMSNQLVKGLRDQLFAHVQRLPIAYFDNLPAGKVVSRITNDTEVVRQQFYENAVSTMLSSLVGIIGTYIAIFLLNVQLGLALLVLVPILLVWQYIFAKYASKINLGLRELVSEMNGKLNEAIQGMPIIQAFQQEDRFAKEYQESSDAWVKEGSRSLILDSGFSWGLIAFLRNATLMSVVMFLAASYLGGTLGLTAGTIYAFIDYVNRLFDPIDAFVQVFSNFQQAIAAGTRIFELADQTPEQDPQEVFHMTQGAVRFEDVDFAYDGENKVLHQIDFEAKPGQVVAFVGHTGSGKSSIMNLLFRFYDPTGGRVLIDGQDTRHFDRRTVRSQMGIVLQDPYLFTGTIGSNISMGDQNISRQEIEQALIQVGGEHLLHKSSLGIDFEVKEKGADFSSGERQLISFARALVFNPKILILDEATSHVDTQTEEVIQKAMEVLEKGRTTFIIAHRLSTIVNADQILVLDKGRIIESGTHHSLIAQGGTYAQMYQTQIAGPSQQGA